jgi:hypothetical protein
VGHAVAQRSAYGKDGKDQNSGSSSGSGGSAAAGSVTTAQGAKAREALTHLLNLKAGEMGYIPVVGAIVKPLHGLGYRVAGMRDRIPHLSDHEAIAILRVLTVKYVEGELYLSDFEKAGLIPLDESAMATTATATTVAVSGASTGLSAADFVQGAATAGDVSGGAAAPFTLPASAAMTGMGQENTRNKFLLAVKDLGLVSPNQKIKLKKELRGGNLNCMATDDSCKVG